MNLPQWLKQGCVCTSVKNLSPFCFLQRINKVNCVSVLPECLMKLRTTYDYKGINCAPPAPTGSEEEGGRGRSRGFLNSTVHSFWWHKVTLNGPFVHQTQKSIELKLCSLCTSWSVWRKLKLCAKKCSFPRTVQSVRRPGSTGLFSEAFREKDRRTADWKMLRLLSNNLKHQPL